MDNLLGQTLERLRGRLTLREVARKSGLSHTYIRDLELGINRKTKAPIKPSPEVLKGLSSVYDFSYIELMYMAGYVDEAEDLSLEESREEETEMERMKREIREIVNMAKTDDDVRSILHIVKKVMKE